MPRITSRGIHHVATDQKKRLKPARKGRRNWRRSHFRSKRRSSAPARVVIATAPMLIQ